MAVTTKKRGRPSKDPMIVAVEAPKRRGRPDKNPVIANQPKKRGRPAGTRVKHVPTVESVTTEWHKRYSEMMQYYDGILAKADEQYDAMRLKIHNLEHQAIGYRAVISYLENTIERLIANPV